jgi:hypothetical protein
LAARPKRIVVVIRECLKLVGWGWVSVWQGIALPAGAHNLHAFRCPGAIGAHSSALEETAMPINDLSYDVLTALQSKLESAAAYETFIEDSVEAGDDECRRLFEQMRQRDEQDAEQLTRTLERLVREGRLH